MQSASIILRSLHRSDNVFVYSTTMPKFGINPLNVTLSTVENSHGAVLFGSIMTFISLAGVIGNASLLWVIYRNKSFQTPFSNYIICLAVSDIFVCGFGFPMTVISCWYNRWVFGEIGCTLYAFVNSVVGLQSIHIMTAMAIERYTVVAHPLSIYKTSTIARARLFIGISFVFSTLWSFPPLVGWNRTVLEGWRVSCSFDFYSTDWNDRSYCLFLIIGAFLIPVMIIISSYSGIVRQINKERHRMRSFQNPPELRRLQLLERKITQLSFSITVTFCCSWLPYALVSFYGVLGGQPLSPVYTAVAALLAKSSAIYNPLVYFIVQQKFRQRVLSCWIPFRKYPVSQTNSLSQMNTRRSHEDNPERNSNTIPDMTSSDTECSKAMVIHTNNNVKFKDSRRSSRDGNSKRKMTAIDIGIITANVGDLKQSSDSALSLKSPFSPFQTMNAYAKFPHFRRKYKIPKKNLHVAFSREHN